MIADDKLDALMDVMESGFDPHWREAWTRVQVSDSLEMPSTGLLLVDRSGQTWKSGRAAGFVLSRQALDEEELLLIAVRPEERGRGLGAALLQQYLELGKRRGSSLVFLEMRANNPAASIYRRAGFIPIGTRSRYYRTSDGQSIDAITLACDLT